MCAVGVPPDVRGGRSVGVIWRTGPGRCYGDRRVTVPALSPGLSLVTTVTEYGAFRID